MKGYILRQHMADSGIKVIDIASTLGVTHAAVSRCIHGQTKSLRIRKAIADAIGKPINEVFPEATTKEAA
ncbi:putative transcriptional regulator, Nlp [Desulfobulbus propionicus DSM 2032]|uniref:Transcriptional regulator, Nlp n=1 Tax=Desulfobulbus propionicus (strain ATCC 33891 / DSM 2032 / VKM B-1956 / 1pr3) TaxID=577650 RepID=A0A7U3YJ92_DESPD|nr:helix-turn-helix transcriptional regulator [Desulfobulbus propionicus]ADW16415.1 putative transcriptional regulator, Nlp [Desulfobulbus propionicus DSM 2032]